MNYKAARLKRLELEITQGDMAVAIGVPGWKLSLAERHGMALPPDAEKKLFAILGLSDAEPKQTGADTAAGGPVSGETGKGNA